MKQRKKPYETDPLDLRDRRRRRRARERRVKWLLSLAAILIIILIAIVFRRIALSRFGGIFKAPIENPTYWYQQTEQVLFRTITPTPSQSPTPTVPTPTFTATPTPTPTVSPTPTLTPTPKLRPRKTVEGGAFNMLAEAESTMTARRYSQQNSSSVEYSDVWFEVLGTAYLFDAAEIYPEADCTWMGVAGQLIDKRGNPQIGYYVQVVFSDGSLVETLSGLFPGYGDAGYEITIARPVQNIENWVWIQVLDEQHRPASDRFYFHPSHLCDKSLTMINFQRIK